MFTLLLNMARWWKSTAASLFVQCSHVNQQKRLFEIFIREQLQWCLKPEFWQCFNQACLLHFHEVKKQLNVVIVLAYLLVSNSMG